MSERAEIKLVELIRRLRDLGVAAGDILLVHMSFRAVGPVEGGLLGLIASLARGAWRERYIGHAVLVRQ